MKDATARQFAAGESFTVVPGDASEMIFVGKYR